MFLNLKLLYKLMYIEFYVSRRLSDKFYNIKTANKIVNKNENSKYL